MTFIGFYLLSLFYVLFLSIPVDTFVCPSPTAQNWDINSVTMSEDSSSMGNASSAVTSEKVPCAAEQITENAKNVDRDDGCSGKPSSLGM